MTSPDPDPTDAKKKGQAEAEVVDAATSKGVVYFCLLDLSE